jgi:hypothetical protein
VAVLHHLADPKPQAEIQRAYRARLAAQAADAAATRPDLKTFVEMRDKLYNALWELELSWTLAFSRSAPSVMARLFWCRDCRNASSLRSAPGAGTGLILPTVGRVCAERISWGSRDGRPFCYGRRELSPH